MEGKKTVSTALCSVIIGGFILTLGGVAIADSGTIAGKCSVPFKQGVKQGMLQGNKAGNMTQSLKETLTSLVSNSTITQEEADKLLAWEQKMAEDRKAEQEEFKNMTQAERQALAEEKKAEMDKFKNMTKEEREALKAEKKDKKAGLIEDAVSQGIITQEQADKINETMRSQAQEQQQANLQAKFNTLVDQGTISSEQADAIIEKMEEMAEERKAEMDKMKTLTEEERRQLMKEKKEKNGLLGQMVEDGTLTQEQADAVSKILGPQGQRGGQGPSGNPPPAATE